MRYLCTRKLTFAVRDDAIERQEGVLRMLNKNCEAEIRPIEPGRVIPGREHAEPHIVLLFI